MIDSASITMSRGIAQVPAGMAPNVGEDAARRKRLKNRLRTNMNSQLIEFSRRRFLRGLGVTLALPALDSILPVRALAAAAPATPAA